MGKRKTKMKLSSRNNGTLIPDDEYESDSDFQEFPLPKKRIIKPGKSTYVARRRCDCCRVCASVFLSVLLIASVLCVVVLGWFSLRLKRDLDFVKKRLSKVESYDRSTTREYEELNNNMNNKYKQLTASEEEATKQDNEHYKSILRQIAHLNSTVDDLQKRVERPESANKITSDIESLKKGMADTGGDITEIKDKIKQLTDLAGQQNGRVDKLIKEFFNLSVQVAHIMGKPTPQPLKNTGTPPLILRMPVSSDEKATPEDKVSIKNLTAIVSVEVARVMGIVTSVNHTLSHEVNRLRMWMKSLLSAVKKHVATIDDLQTKMSQILKPNHSSVVSRGHLGEDIVDVSEQVLNLSVDVTTLMKDVHKHSIMLAELMLDLVQVNRTVHHQRRIVTPEKSVTCNCSAEVGKLQEQLSSNKLNIESMQQQLQALQKPVENNIPESTSAPANVHVEANITVTKETTQNQSLSDSTAETDETDKDLAQEGEGSEDVKSSPSSGSNANDSVTVEKVTESSLLSSSSGPALAEPQTSAPTNNTSPPKIIVSNSTESNQRPALAEPQTSAPTNSTSPPKVIVSNSTESNQTLPTDSKVEMKVTKLSTPSSEEKIEDILENADSES